MVDPPARVPAAARRLHLDVPAGWRVRELGGPPLFVTHATLVAPDGRVVQWTSRRHRKSSASATSRWMGGLFGIGAILFALGSVPLYFDTVEPDAVAATFFVGSIFFTAAAYLQYHEAAHAPTAVGRPEPAASRRAAVSPLGWQPHRIAWWAALVQLVGTVLFNVSTFVATREDVSLHQARRLIWVPDVWGSVCFLVASALAYSEICPRLRQRPDWTVEWWIGAVNLAGSIFFGLAAIGARYLRTTGEPANIALVNLGTFAGALCFLAGAVLLPVESARLPRQAVSA